MENRVQWLDIAKGIAIILMVLGHTSIPKLASNFIWAFHMPLFFIASGWATSWGKRSFGEFLTKRAKSLFLPFIIYSAIVLDILVYHDWYSINELLTKGWGGFALWFIPVLFFASLLSKGIKKIKGRYSQICAIVVLLFIGAMLSYNKIILPWSISSIPYATCLIVIGTELKSIEELIEKNHLYLTPLFLAITFLISLFWKLDMCVNSISPVVPISFGTISGTLMVFCISIWTNKHTKILSSVLQNIGKETFLILAFSQVIIMLINEYFNPLAELI